MLSYKSIIFPLFGVDEKVQDINKDANDKGTLERYNEIIGDDIDQNIRPLATDLVDNVLAVPTFYAKFIPNAEEDMGIDFVIYDSEVWRRRVIRFLQDWVEIKGTKRAYRVMLGMIGVNVTNIIESFSSYSFDSPVKFDDPVRRFDMQCLACTGYTIYAEGIPLPTDELIAAITAIVRFNQPINAKLTDFIYNGESIQPVIDNAAFSYGFSIGFNS